MIGYEPFIEEFYAEDQKTGESYCMADGEWRHMGWYCVPDWMNKRMRVFAYHGTDNRWFDGPTCREDAKQWLKEMDK